MKKLLILAVAIVMLTAQFTACGPIASILGDAIDNSSDTPQTVATRSGDLTMEFPGSWTNLVLNEVAAVQMGFALKEQYMIVIEESAEDFDEDFTIDEYAQIIAGNMLVSVESAETTPIADVTIGSEIAAKQFEITGSVNKIKVKYVITCAIYNNTYYQFTAWSLQSKYGEAKSVFDTILQSVSAKSI